MIPELRAEFNQQFRPQAYERLMAELEQICEAPVEFRVAETPVFVPYALLESMANAGAEMAISLIGNADYLRAARAAIPAPYLVAGETAHPKFLTADFGLVRNEEGDLAPRLVELQAFPSVYGYQAALCEAYRKVYGIDDRLDTFLGGLNEADYWTLLTRTVLGTNDPLHVVLTEIDPASQKTRPDFEVTARRLGIAVVDIRSLEAQDNRLCYRSEAGHLVPIHCIYNRAIVDEMIARQVRLPFDLTHAWDVEWAGHPNWYFLISKFSVPWLSRGPLRHPAVPPAVYLSEFLEGAGRAELEQAGVPLPGAAGAQTVYPELVLKPLFSFAGKGIQFGPTQGQLEAIPPGERENYLLQQRMHFAPTVDTPRGPTQAEIRILYLWPDGGLLTPALALVRLGRGSMMGVDHNRGQEWVGASAAFYPRPRTGLETSLTE